MVDPLKNEKQILSNKNKALISIVSKPGFVVFAQNKRLNLFQRVIGHFAFFGNILILFFQFFYQMGMIVSYESI